ncbi:MAG TPA: adenylate/guanylate cyclase domain-containing protein [Elusimicrobiales bacterium]|nr:adenylate/guanylate cyclase domain-containing protein [Elusimicrobiales bacterium]
MMYRKAKHKAGRLRETAKVFALWYARRKNFVHNWAHIAVPLALLLLLTAVRVSGWGWVETLQNKAFDTLIILKPRAYEAVPVRIIDIDDASLARLGQWPWPRTQLAKLVNKLSAQGAAVIAFDAVFAEPDRTSPARVMEDWPPTPEVQALKKNLDRLPDNDQVFARAIAKASVVTGFALNFDDNKTVPAERAAFSFAGDGPLNYLLNFSGAVTNLPEFEQAAAGNGSFSLLPEPDGVVRRAPLIFRQGTVLLPSLAAEALRVVQGAAGYSVKSSGASGEGGGRTGIVKIKIGSFIVPTEADSKVWVYFTENAPERTIPAWKIFEKDFDASPVDGAIAFVGTSAAGLKDLRVTALNPMLPGVEVHANLAEQVLLNKYLDRPDWAPGAEVLYMLFFGGLLLLLFPRLGASWCAWAAGAGVAAALYASWRAFSAHGYLLDPVFPVLTVVLIYMSSSLISYLKSETERRQVRNAFSRYMHPKLVEELAKHPEKLKLGGETRSMTILFCDIRGFTTISEQYDAHGLTAVINRFLTPMTGIIMEKLGYIDKYIGDCIMAFWNAPLDDAQHAANACEAALTMQETLKKLNEGWRLEAEGAGRKHLPINIGVGLNTGPCCVGNMGADQRFNYSVLGDDVNLASRLESQSKTYGVGIIIGPRTREQAPDFAVLELDLVKVKGKTVPVNIFVLLGRKAIKESAEFQAREKLHNRMLTAYRGQNWEEAQELLKACRAAAAFPLPVLYDMYEARIKTLKAAPPGKDWDGAYTATSK